MKNVSHLTASLAVLAGLALFVPSVQAQTAGTAAASSSGFKVALIDMAHVFKNYKKFEALRDDLKAEIEKSDQQAKAMAVNLKNIQDQMKAYTEGSAEYVKFESQLAKEASSFEAFRKLAQRDFLRKEAEIYKTVYLEVTDAVKLYSQHYQYSMVLRFSRDGVEDTGNPTQVLQSMNRQIVDYDKQHDITDAVLNYLNKKYAPTNPAAGGTATRPSTGTQSN